MPQPTNIEVNERTELVQFDYRGEILTALIQEDQTGDFYFIWYDNAERPHVEYINN